MVARLLDSPAGLFILGVVALVVILALLNALFGRDEPKQEQWEHKTAKQAMREAREASLSRDAAREQRIDQAFEDALRKAGR